MRATAGWPSSALSNSAPLLDKPAVAPNAGTHWMVRTFMCGWRSHGRLPLWLPCVFDFRVSIAFCSRCQTVADSTRQASCDCVARTQKSGPSPFCEAAIGRHCWLAQRCESYCGRGCSALFPRVRGCGHTSGGSLRSTSSHPVRGMLASHWALASHPSPIDSLLRGR